VCFPTSSAKSFSSVALQNDLIHSYRPIMNNSIASSLTAARLARERLESIVQSLPVLSQQLEGMDGSIRPVVAVANGTAAPTATATTITLTENVCKDQGRLSVYEANCNNESSPLNSQQKNQTSYNSYYSRVPAPTKQKNVRTEDLLSPAILKMASSAKEPTFPVKLHMILSNPAFDDIITWLPHGRSWTIHNQKAFEERVIPLYFRHGRFASFARQVNGWGFRRVTQGSDYNSYYHEVRNSNANNCAFSCYYSGSEVDCPDFLPFLFVFLDHHSCFFVACLIFARR
jgi:hypothetical protein